MASPMQPSATTQSDISKLAKKMAAKQQAAQNLLVQPESLNTVLYRPIGLGILNALFAPCPPPCAEEEEERSLSSKEVMISIMYVKSS